MLRGTVEKIKKFFWPTVGVVAVVWSVHLLFVKLQAEVAGDPVVRKLLEQGGLWSDLKIIASVIGQKLAGIPGQSYLYAGLSALVAYAALAYYDRIALLHLGRTQGISWLYLSTTSFVTYALAHNIGASVISGGMVRYRAYSAKGLSASEVAMLVALCSFTFTYGTVMLIGAVLTWNPALLQPLGKLSFLFALGDTATRSIGILMLLLCALYVYGSWKNFKPLKIRSLLVVYPRLPIVFRQIIAAPMELLGAAGIIHFALPSEGHPGYFVVLGAFLLSFSAGLLSQVPGGVGVMEAVFLAIMPQLSPTSVFAALLVWRLFYLILPLLLSLPVILLFEQSQLGKTTKHLEIPTEV